MLAGLMPEDGEVLGLLALMEIQASRLGALARAEALGGDGPYVLQAALAACHARAHRAAETDWSRIAALYDRLRVVAPSPVVDLNRAIAHSMAFGPLF